MKKKLIFFLKLLFTIAVLYFLLKNIDIEQSVKTFLKINPVVFILLIMIYVLGQVLSACKWAIISSNLDFKYKLPQYIQYYFIGMFFNLFLPTGVGGDVTKAYYLCCKNKTKYSEANSILSIFADRFTGIMVLGTICFIGLFFKPAQDLNLYIKTFIVFCFVAIMLSIFLHKRTINIDFLMEKKLINKINCCIEQIFSKSLIKIILIAFVFHLLMLFIHFCIGKTMGLNIPVSYYLVLYPITAIATILPISINGIGVREAAYIYLLKFISIDPSQGLVFGICWFAVTVISSLLGALLYIKSIPQKFEI